MYKRRTPTKEYIDAHASTSTLTSSRSGGDNQDV